MTPSQQAKNNLMRVQRFHAMTSVPVNKRIQRAELEQHMAEFYRNGGEAEIVPGFVKPAPRLAVERKPIQTTRQTRYSHRSGGNQFSALCPDGMYSKNGGWDVIRNIGYTMSRDTFYRACESDTGPGLRAYNACHIHGEAEA